jgi:phage terminase large subunit-like protein
VTPSTPAFAARAGAGDEPGSCRAAFARLLRWVNVRVNGGPWADGGPIEYKSLSRLRAPRMSRPEMLAVLEDLMRLTREQRLIILRSLPRPMVRALAAEWWWQVHGGQQEPEVARNGEPWRVWAIVAARGFGKTRAGAEWVWARARENGKARIALVAATFDEAVQVMIEGESGLLAVARGNERPRWIPSKRVLRFPSGAEGHIFSAERPEKLRGPQHHFAWCDELAKWPSGGAGGHPRPTGQAKADTAWNNLMLGLRLGSHPRTIVTTTPRPGPLLKRLIALPHCALTNGRTDENLHLPRDYREAVREMFGGTRLGRQELEGLLLEEYEGALWDRDLIERSRIPSPYRGSGAAKARPGDEPAPDGQVREANQGEGFRRIVIGVDPPASTGGDSCGIVVCVKDGEGLVSVVADLTQGGLSPEAWARRVVDAADLYGATRIVAEKNQGGDMIASNLRAVDADLPVKLVHAGPSKAARAEPIALRFETGRARLAGHFPDLEDQLCALTWSGYQGPGSPDRADAMVWAMTELFEKERAAPRIRQL